MAEWFKAHAWNACWVQALAGSNPVLSAKQRRAFWFFFAWLKNCEPAIFSERKTGSAK